MEPDNVKNQFVFPNNVLMTGNLILRPDSNQEKTTFLFSYHNWLFTCDLFFLEFFYDERDGLDIGCLNFHN